MKIKIALQLFVLCLVITTFSQCTRVDMEDSGIQKTAILKHNYMPLQLKIISRAGWKCSIAWWGSMVKTK